jgi:anti-sigma B factor antagonist/stage II sporulation protein AA (anti-sigma F factor antagonist)
MEISKEFLNNILVVKLKGKLDAISSPSVGQQLHDFISEGATLLILDLKELDYISSAGLQIILQITKKISSLNGKFAICSLSSDVNDVIEMSGFSSFISIYDDIQAAIDSF